MGSVVVAVMGGILKEVVIRVEKEEEVYQCHLWVQGHGDLTLIMVKCLWQQQQQLWQQRQQQVVLLQCPKRLVDYQSQAVLLFQLRTSSSGRPLFTCRQV